MFFLAVKCIEVISGRVLYLTAVNLSKSAFVVVKAHFLHRVALLDATCLYKLNKQAEAASTDYTVYIYRSSAHASPF